MLKYLLIVLTLKGYCMDLPKEYIDETYGVRSAANAPGFNNIVFTAWYHVYKKHNKNMTTDDFSSLVAHLKLNNDEYGLYKPKNSHDNITYKMILVELFGLQKDNDMSFIQASKDAGFYRIGDIITYGYSFGPKLLKPLFGLLLFIPALMMIEAVYNEGKVRPHLIESDSSDSRFPWWFLPKTLVKEYSAVNDTQIHKEWKDYKGRTRITRHMQNDGKHLAIFRLYALKDKSLVFKLTSRICRSILIKRYGENYTSEIIKNYFIDRNHPLIKLWENNGDILK